jgi:hypothetical protein
MRPRMRYDIGDNDTWERIGMELFVQVAWLYSQLVLGWYFILKNYFCRFKILMESMFSGDEFLPSEKYFENGIFCHNSLFLEKCQ